MYVSQLRYSYFFFRACEELCIKRAYNFKGNKFLSVLYTTRDLLAHWNRAMTAANAAELSDNMVTVLKLMKCDLTKRVAFSDVRPMHCFVQNGWTDYSLGVLLNRILLTHVEEAFKALPDDVIAALRDVADLLPSDM